MGAIQKVGQSSWPLNDLVNLSDHIHYYSTSLSSELKKGGGDKRKTHLFDGQGARENIYTQKYLHFQKYLHIQRIYS